MILPNEKYDADECIKIEFVDSQDLGYQRDQGWEILPCWEGLKLSM